MRERCIPVRVRRRFVLVVAEAHDHLHRLLPVRPFQVFGCVVNRVAAHDDERFDFLVINVFREFRDRLRGLLGELPPDDCLADVAQRRVDRRHQHLHRRRLPRPDQHEARAFVLQQIFRGNLDPLGIELHRRSTKRRRRLHERSVLGGRRDFRRQGEREGPDLARRHAHPVVRDAARHCVAILGHVEPVHLRAWPRHFPPRGKLPDRVHVALDAEEIAVQRHDDVRLVDHRHRRHAAAKRRRRRLVGEFGAERFIDGPRRLRKFLRDLAAQPLAGRRVVFLEQERQPRAIPRRADEPVERLLKRRRVGLFALFHKKARAIRVVEIKHGRLRVHVGRALAHRMLRIALDFRRATIMRHRHQRGIAPARRPRRGVKDRLARDRPLHAAREWHQMLLRPAAPRETQPRQRHRGTHELEEIAARNLAPLHLRRALRKLPRQPAAELRRIAELPERAPVLAARRGLRGMLEDSFAHR